MRALHQAKVGLPRSQRYVLQAHENEALEADGTRTDPPCRFERVLHILMLHFLWGLSATGNTQRLNGANF